ncbi:MAG: spermidine/putrescine ABC transporter substrate-binding protein [bacterium]|nr:spermidine/putrescine ABC transporter substrate-binding protein [bacterium]
MIKKIIVILFMIMLCCGCNNQEERTLNVLNWSSYIPDEIIRDFERKTSIKVNYSTYSSNEELLAKISSVKEGTYDLIFPSDYMIEIMKSKGMIETIDKSRLSNLSNLNYNFLGLSYDSGNDYSIPFLATSVVISVNTDNIKEDIISYSDLLNSKYKNDIVLIDDQRIIIGMALLACGHDMNTTSEEELNDAYLWLKKLKPNIKAYDSDSPKNFLINNEANIAVLWNAEGAIASNTNKSIKNIFPSEGFALSIDNFAIPRGAKNKDELYEFMDYILDAQIMAQIIESYPYKTVNKKSEKYLSSEYMNNNASNISDAIISEGYFVKNIGDKIKLYDKLWAKIK